MRMPRMAVKLTRQWSLGRSVRSALRGADHLLPELQDLVLIPFGHESMAARTHHSDVAAGHV